MEEEKISQNLSYWRLAQPVRNMFFFFTIAHFNHSVINFPCFALCFFWQQRPSVFGLRSPLCLKILLRRLERQRHFKSKFAFLQTKARLFQLDQFVECGRILAGLILEERIQVQKKKEEIHCPVFGYSRKRLIERFHVVVSTFSIHVHPCHQYQQTARNISNA